MALFVLFVSTVNNNISMRFLLILVLAVVALSAAQQFPIDGKWTNELGSTMVVQAYSNGTLQGMYQSKVGTSPEDGAFPLQGTHTFASNGTTFGFTVSWTNEQFLTTTAWSGQYFFDKDNNALLVTTWTLVNATNPKDAWESTNIGMDTFKRT